MRENELVCDDCEDASYKNWEEAVFAFTVFLARTNDSGSDSDFVSDSELILLDCIFTIMATVGYFFSFGSLVCNGSFGAISKSRAVVDVRPCIHPAVFNFYAILGVFASSLTILFVDGVHIDWSRGVLSGFLFAAAFMLTFQAIDRIGVAAAQGIWSGVAICVSFIWGTLGPKGLALPPREPGLCVLALSIIISGVVFIVFALRSKSAPSSSIHKAKDEENQSPTAVPDNESTALLKEKKIAPVYVSSKISGIVFASLVGVLGGSLLVPESFSSVKGIRFVPSLGIGAFISNLFFTAVFLAIGNWKRAEGDDAISFKLPLPALVCALLAGVVWNVGNTFCLLAIKSIGYSVAMPVMNAAIIPAGVYGIFLFGEIKERRNIYFFAVGAAIVMCGTALLAYAGPQPSP